ncbi:Coiled-coil domain-containing protein 90B, mitochondrial [Geodia barretti]|uniref:Coiled-coil domain-containing protein 90B, mitochondrial n=1 Tax=Geodia barretti TaxID=519541 RepID=A0AA35T066_GEOBA|nr:Coiled-coil domain-containing protein 90B, mitochondrial [Geodia barretti]
MGFYARRGGAGLLRACVLRPQCRVSSTEAGQEPQATSSGLLLERRASSSWSGDRSPVTKELSSPGFLRRALPDSLANGETQQVPRFFIDTQAMVRTLEDGGYSREQAESVVSLISTSLTATLEPVISAQVTRRDVELLAVQFAGEVESVRSSLVLLERSTIDSLRLENEGLRGQIRRLYENQKEEMKKLESGIQLDINLEKGRLREESTNLSQRIKDTHNRIETEVQQYLLPSLFLLL